MSSLEPLSWRDRWYVIMDVMEYFLRRIRCRVIGHKWTAECESDGYQSYITSYYCTRCHRYEL